MTLLINAITHKWAFNVSDRLLTKNAGGELSQFDKTSNKSIVFFPNDAIVTLSFTGTAFIRSIPTDRWISETLTEHNLSEGNDFKIIAEGEKRETLFNSINKLTEQLNKTWPSLPTEQKKPDLGIIICGWVRTKSKPNFRPILWYLKGNGTPKSPFHFKKYQRFWPSRQIATLHSGVILDNEQNKHLTKCISEERKNGTEKSAERAIVKVLREVAKQHETVGSDCMAVRMSYWSKPQVIITYYPDPNLEIPLKSKKAPIESRTGFVIGYGKKEDMTKLPPNIEEMKPYFTPWIISPNGIIPPSSIIGNLNHSFGDFTVQINGPSPPKGLIGGIISQSRPTKP